MKKTKWFLVAIMCISILACSDVKEGEDVAMEKPIPIKWLTVGDGGAKPMVKDDRIIQKINEYLGIELEIVLVPDGNFEKINVAMASGDFPDIVTGEFGTSATQQWIENGMILELNPYIEANPAIGEWLEINYPWTADADGKYYGMPFINQYKSANALIIMREDWLENVGLFYPTTLDEMKEVLLAFTNDDPDGNGQNDTIGYTDSKPIGTFGWVFFANGLEYADFAINENDEVIPWFEDPSFKPGLEYLLDLWNSGVIDKEFMLNDGTKVEEKFYQGKSGSMVRALFRHVSRHEGNLQKISPDATITYGLPPTGDDGAFGLTKQGKDGMFTCITAISENPEKAAEFMNFLVSEEGNDLLRLGIEGIHYTEEDGKIIFNEEERQKDAFSDNGWGHPLAWGNFYWPLESDYLPETEPSRDRALETTKLATEAQVPNLIKQKTPFEIRYGGRLDDIYNQYFSDILQGKYSIDEGIEKLSESWRSQGGDELLAEVNEVYQNQK